MTPPYNNGQNFGSQSPIVSEKSDSDDVEKHGREKPSSKKQCCKKSHIATLYPYLVWTGPVRVGCATGFKVYVFAEQICDMATQSRAATLTSP